MRPLLALRQLLVSLAWTTLALGAIAAVALTPAARNILAEALSHVTIKVVLATIPGQAISCLLCGGALFLLRPGVSLGTAIVARSLRDAGANLLVFLPGLGEIIGARALVLAGCQAVPAVSASALDNLAETAAQVPFALVAFAMLPRIWDDAGGLPREVTRGLLTLALPLVGLSASLAIAAASLPAIRRRYSALFARSRAAVTRALHHVRDQRRGFPGALLLHALAWAMGGVQLWMAARALALPLGICQAIVIESVVYTMRGFAFFVPAGLAVQEWAIVLAGALYGLKPEQSLTLGLTLRLRDVVFGVVLLLWPVMELACARRTHLRGVLAE